MRLHGRDYTRNEALRYVGHPSQLGGTRHYELSDGAARGVRAVDFDTGSGFRFTVLPDRGMDISAATYRGMNLAFRTPNWESAPAFAEREGLGWLRTFFGGLLTTCGLTSFGPPCEDQGERLGLHGRYSCTPARQVCDTSGWRDDEYELSVRGVVEECVIFGHKMRMERTVETYVGADHVVLHDRITNFGALPSPFTILYHVNVGFPLLGPQAELLVSRTSTVPNNDAARQAGLDRVTRFEEPQPGFAEQVYLHRVIGDAQGHARAACVNRSLGHGGLGLYVKFPVAVLPVMTEWKMMGAGDYVLGMEPCNVDLMSRAEMRQRGLLPMLAPGQSMEIDVEIGVLDGTDAIETFARQVGT